MIKLEDVSFSYTGKGNDYMVLKDIDLTFEDGQFVCIVGHSGCGKSTMLRLIAGLEKPTSGTICIDGAPLEGPSADTAIVFQHYPLFPWMKVLGNMVFGIQHSANKTTRQEAKRIALEYLEAVGMQEWAKAYPYQLSGGMKQRVALARSLAMNPEYLFLDEPFGALDIRMRIELQGLTEKIWIESGKLRNIVFVTHDIDEAILLADRIVFMEPARVGKVIDVDWPRPRDKQHIQSLDEFQALRNDLLGFFYAEMERENSAEGEGESHEQA